jgi:heat shock protein HtpX
MTHYDLIAKNKRSSWIVIAIFVFFVLFLGLNAAVAYGNDVAIFALLFAGGMSFASYWWSDKIILTMSGARVASREEFFDFYTVAENLAMSQQLPLPKLYVIEDTAMNAFATGRDPEHAVICATTGLLKRLERGEIEGVIAHELAHIKNYDIRLMSIVAILVGFVALLADWMLRLSLTRGKKDSEGAGQLQVLFMVGGFILTLFSPIIAQLIQLSLSRKREFLADSTGISMTKNPEGLARALEKISQDTEPLEAANKATAHLYIANPLKNHHDAVGWFSGLFKTHPPVTERVRALRGLLS